MGIVQFLVSGFLTIIVYSMALYGVFRIVRLSSEVSEIKEMLREIRRNLEAAPVPRAAEGAAPPQPMSAEELVRAVHSSYHQTE